MMLPPKGRPIMWTTGVPLLWSQALLEVVNDLFEEQTDLEKIVRKIMQRALTLLQCERCSVLLLEDIDSPVRPYQLLSRCCLAASSAGLCCCPPVVTLIVVYRLWSSQRRLSSCLRYATWTTTSGERDRWKKQRQTESDTWTNIIFTAVMLNVQVTRLTMAFWFQHGEAVMFWLADQ